MTDVLYSLWILLTFHNRLNSNIPNIHFTAQKESHGRLPFLDILLTQDEYGSISTSAYRKATHTGQYLKFQSHYQAAHKRIVIKTLMYRAEALLTSGVSRTEEEKHITKALQRNGRPIGYLQAHRFTAQPEATR